MNSRRYFLSFVTLACALLLPAPAVRAQSSPREAADMLHALNIQIGEAQRNGDRKRVSLLQNRYMDIQKKWGVKPTDNRPEPPVARPRNWSSSENGSGRISGYRGGKIRIQRASVSIPSFWDADGPSRGGRSAVLRFVDEEGNDFIFSGSWSYEGNRVVSFRVTDTGNRFFTGTLTMARDGFSTVNLIGEGRGEGISVTFVK